MKEFGQAQIFLAGRLCYQIKISNDKSGIIETSNAQIKIYNSLGKEINVLYDTELSPGKYNISWDAKDKYGNSLPSGVYLIVLQTKNSVKTFKSILLK